MYLYNFLSNIHIYGHNSNIKTFHTEQFTLSDRDKTKNTTGI